MSPNLPASLVAVRVAVCVAVCLALPASAAPPSTPGNGSYVATAYSVTGITASGEWTHRHVIAADPDVLPIGSRVKIRRAGKYSGEYVVADTGAKILGRKLDIYMPSTKECLKFGSRRVRVWVIELGDGTRAATKEADKAVKRDVDKDVAKGVVGNAATETDWKAKGAVPPKSAEPVTSAAPAAPPN